MSAAVLCGSKRLFFEDIPSSASAPKRLQRCSSPSSPSSCVRFPSSSVHFFPLPRSLDHLQALFPHMDPELLERSLVECGNDIDTAIKRLQQQLCCLGLGAAVEVTGEKSGPVEEQLCSTTADEAAAAAVPVQNPPAAAENLLPVDGADQWVELFVREMTSATSLDEAKSRVSTLLGVVLKKKVIAAQKEENIIRVKQQQQIEALIRENRVLKRAVAIQHERQNDYEHKSNELQHLKEQLRTLELNNFALTMHLRQAQQSNPIAGRFHPDVF